MSLALRHGHIYMLAMCSPQKNKLVRNKHKKKSSPTNLGAVYVHAVRRHTPSSRTHTGAEQRVLAKSSPRKIINRLCTHFRTCVTSGYSLPLCTPRHRHPCRPDGTPSTLYSNRDLSIPSQSPRLGSGTSCDIARLGLGLGNACAETVTPLPCCLSRRRGAQ